MREHRGDSHIAACVAAGLDPVAMNVLTELWVGMPLATYSATRGWSEAVLADTADQLRQADLVASLGADVDDLIDQLSSWSARCIAASAFPPDVYKRAAG